MGALSGLQELGLGGCSGLTALPESLRALSGLQKLELVGLQRAYRAAGVVVGRCPGCRCSAWGVAAG